MNQPDLEVRTWASQHPKAFRRLLEYAVLFLLTAAAVVALRQEPKTAPASVPVANKPQEATNAVNAAAVAEPDVPEPCGLKDVVCAGEKRVIKATVTTYQAVKGQTDQLPCSGAMPGVDFCHPPFHIVANNCLRLGSKVLINDTTYTVADRMASRYGCDHFDILTDGDNYKLTNATITVL